MFCSKCGHEQLNDGKICEQCGEKLDTAEIIIPKPCIKTPLSISEYFAKECSAEATKRQSTLKKLLRINMVIQFSLLLLGVIVNLRFILVPMILLFILLRFVIGGAFAIGSVIFSKKGIEKKSLGLLCASCIFAFFSTAAGTVLAINFPPINIVIVGVVIAIHITMIVLNNKDTSEYKDYLHKNK